MSHTFDDDGNGSCTICPLPSNHPCHSVTRPPVPAPEMITSPHQRETSQAAAAATALRSGTIKAAAYEVIANRPGGATCDEVEEALGRTHQSVSAAVNSLMRARHIVPLVRDGAEVHRDTRSGHPAIVWTAAPAEPPKAVVA
jgi:hypothetical protein